MSEIKKAFKHRGLLPIQAEFACDVAKQQNTPARFLLQSELGLGKKWVCANLISELLQLNEMNRVLVMLPDPQTCSLFAEYLIEARCNLKPILVLKHEMRFFVSEWSEQSFLPKKGIVLMPEEVVREPQMLNLILNGKWDLTVTDEVDWFISGKVSVVLKQLYTLSTKHVLLADDLVEGEVSNRLQRLNGMLAEIGEFSVAQWSSDEITGWEGDRIEVSSAERRTVNYQLGDEEKLCLEGLEEGSLAIGGFEFWDRVKVMARSSLYTAERFVTKEIQKIRRRRNEIMFSVSEMEGNLPNSAANERAINYPVGFEFPEEARISGFIEELERLEKGVFKNWCDSECDSKVDALLHLLNDLSDEKICIVTEFAETANYINTVLLDVSVDVVLLRTEMTRFEINSLLMKFHESEAGVLIVTDDVMRGTKLGCEVNTLVNYDVNLNKGYDTSPEIREVLLIEVGRRSTLKSINLEVIE
ncbi:helicase-related protein [Mariniblastus sp.]|nr:helicase-related protein [Mariniblastus sp.]